MLYPAELRGLKNYLIANKTEAEIRSSGIIKEFTMTKFRTTILISAILKVLVFVSMATAKENKNNSLVQLEPPCLQLPEGSGVVSKLSKQNIIILDDGRKLKLANIYTSKKLSHSYLKNLIFKKPITFYASGRKKDRHNRHLVQIFFQENGNRIWLQSHLISQGLAVPLALPNTKQCFLELLENEKKARSKDLEDQSINQHFPIIKSNNLKILNEKVQGSFQIVEGKLWSISRTAKNTYLNFSDNWRTDFTVMISNHLLKRKKDKWPNLKAMKGKTIRVRGWLDHYNGPMIRLDVPEMLEALAQSE